MSEKYRESLDLFRRIYFKEEDGTLNTEGYNQYFTSDKKEYLSLGKDYTNLGDGRSKIVGKSAFTPRIQREPINNRHDIYHPTGYKYFLTLDNQGKFDHHFDQFYNTNRENIQEIDVTDMSPDDIMARVDQILNMSNEEIMTMFNIQKTYSTKLKIELLIDDIVQQYFEQQGQEVKYTNYVPEFGIITELDKGYVEQRSYEYDPETPTRIVINPKGKFEFDEDVDKISYKVLTPEEFDISKIKIEIEKANVNSELGKEILQNLKERFTERQIEEEQQEEVQTSEEKTGAEKIIEFMEQNNLEPHDLALALSMTLAKTTDRTEAEQHIVNAVNKEREDPENMKSQH